MFGEKYTSVKKVKSMCDVTAECSGINCKKGGKCQMSEDDKGTSDKGYISYYCGQIQDEKRRNWRTDADS